MLPSIIMTQEEIEQAEEQSLELEREFLDRPKQERTRTVEPRMLRTREAAQYLAISEWKLRSMVYSGQIECVRQKYWLFSIDDLAKWIARERG